VKILVQQTHNLPAEELDGRSFNFLEIVYTQSCLQPSKQELECSDTSNAIRVLMERAGAYLFSAGHCPRSADMY